MESIACRVESREPPGHVDPKARSKKPGRAGAPVDARGRCRPGTVARPGRRSQSRRDRAIISIGIIMRPSIGSHESGVNGGAGAPRSVRAVAPLVPCTRGLSRGRAPSARGTAPKPSPSQWARLSRFWSGCRGRSRAAPCPRRIRGGFGQGKWPERPPGGAVTICIRPRMRTTAATYCFSSGRRRPRRGDAHAGHAIATNVTVVCLEAFIDQCLS